MNDDLATFVWGQVPFLTTSRRKDTIAHLSSFQLSRTPQLRGVKSHARKAVDFFFVISKKNKHFVPLNRDHFKKESFIFQPSIFRGYVRVQGVE